MHRPPTLTPACNPGSFASKTKQNIFPLSLSLFVPFPSSQPHLSPSLSSPPTPPQNSPLPPSVRFSPLSPSPTITLHIFSLLLFPLFFFCPRIFFFFWWSHPHKPPVLLSPFFSPRSNNAREKATTTTTTHRPTPTITHNTQHRPPFLPLFPLTPCTALRLLNAKERTKEALWRGGGGIGAGRGSQKKGQA